ncbi:MAG TPA: LamG domain-containing protein [Minicystis sp.]|nr:LamG domain-containing protein [Minicystis sp.]
MRGAWGAGALLAAALLGCGGDPATKVCEPGATLACTCEDGRAGAAVCAADRTTFEACVCGQGAASGSGGAGSSSSSMGGGACSQDLSNLGQGDFEVHLELATTQAGQVAVVNQRHVCAQGMFWDLRLYDGRLGMETDDPDHPYVLLESQRTVNDGQPHAIRVARANLQLEIEIDGATDASTSSETAFAALPPLAEGADVCASTDGTVDFAGTLTDVCVARP